MAVNLSPIGGVAGQFFDNNGNPLSGGKIFTYAAGTTTPLATYTSAGGGTPHANPIILDAAGRVPGGEIWLTDGLQYKFIIQTSTSVQIGSYDNVIGINSNFVNYTNSQEIQTATAGQTAFTLTTMQYQPGTNALSVFVDGVNQYGPGASYAYQETSSTVVTFTAGLHVGAQVKFITSALNASSYGDAEQISYTAPYSGAVTSNVELKLAEYVSVKDFGAVGDGVANDYAAFAAALAASNYVYVPPGTYVIGTQITLTGNKTISGSSGNNYEALPSVINFTGVSGNCFSATSAQFGGVTIRNLTIAGGNGGYAIRSSRPQSVFENIKMETYNGGGIQLFEAGTASQASWCTAIRNVKWVGPSTQTAYYGFDITQNGGQLVIDRCNAVNGTIGLNINQGEAITVTGCVFNQQNSARSSAAATDQCGIRLSGAGYKKAIHIVGNYIEACTYAIYVDKCESMTIEDNYIADVGYNAGYSSLYLQSAVSAIVNNVTIRNNVFQDQGASSASIDIGNYAKNVVVENNYLRLTGANSIAIRKGTQYFSWIRNNDIQVNPSTGIPISDPNRLIADIDYQQAGFTNGKYQYFLASPNTWYDVAPAGRDQIWVLYIARANDPATWHRRDDLFISSTSTTTFVNTYDVNPGYDTPEWRLSGGMIQFRIVGVNNSIQNVSALRLA